MKEMAEDKFVEHEGSVEYVEYNAETAADYHERNQAKASEIRAWLRSEGIGVSEFGVIKPEYVRMYNLAMESATAKHMVDVSNAFEESVARPMREKVHADLVDVNMQAVADDILMPTGSWGSDNGEVPVRNPLDTVKRRKFINYLDLAYMALQEAEMLVGGLILTHHGSDFPTPERISGKMTEIRKLLNIAVLHLVPLDVDFGIEVTSDAVNRATEQLRNMFAGMGANIEFITPPADGWGDEPQF